MYDGQLGGHNFIEEQLYQMKNNMYSSRQSYVTHTQC